MDVIAKIDRTLLDNELRSIIRFAVFRESDRALFNPTYKIKIDDNYPYSTLGGSFYAIPYDDTNRKFKVVYKGTQIYYRDRVFFSIDTLFLYAFCHWLFHLFLADLDYQNRTRIEEV